MIRKATCCCGKASIEVEGDPVFNLVCHCENCKRRTGSAFGISAYFRDSKVINKHDDMGIYEINNDSTEQKRYFCKTCGTTLYWKITKFPAVPNIATMTGIAGGCFNESPLPEPAFSAFSEEKYPWVELPGSCTSIPGRK